MNIFSVSVFAYVLIINSLVAFTVFLYVNDNELKGKDNYSKCRITTKTINKEKFKCIECKGKEGNTMLCDFNRVME